MECDWDGTWTATATWTSGWASGTRIVGFVIADGDGDLNVAVDLAGFVFADENSVLGSGAGDFVIADWDGDGDGGSVLDLAGDAGSSALRAPSTACAPRVQPRLKAAQ